MSEDTTGKQGWVSTAFGTVGGCLLQVLAFLGLAALCGGGLSIILPFVLPLLTSLLVGWLLSTFAPEKSKPMFLSVSVQGGLVVWQVLAVMMAAWLLDVPIGEFLTGQLLEAVAVACVLVWLVLFPGVIPAILLVLYNIFTVVVGIMRYQALQDESGSVVSLLAQILFAGLATYFLITEGWAWRKERGNLSERAAAPDVRADVAETVRMIRAGVYAGIGLPEPLPASQPESTK